MSLTKKVLLHYHLFKNAGTSIDKILRENFPLQCVEREFAAGAGASEAVSWIKACPDAIAFSSHTLNGPLPCGDDVHVFPILFLRHPIARIRSVYSFERTQRAETPGARLARTCSFEDYVNTLLDEQGARQCRNFHVNRLATFSSETGQEFDRAMLALKSLPAFGLVEAFEPSLRWISSALPRELQLRKITDVHVNKSAPTTTELSAETHDRLMRSNEEDIALYGAATEIFERSGYA